jgi:diguanylate cyclase
VHGRSMAPSEPPARSDPFALELARAIDADELHLVHQPLVGRDGQLAGIEALVRWNHPVLGPVGPERIVSAAADELAGRLGRWVRHRALSDRRRWAAIGPPGLHVPTHVNVGAAELDQPHAVERILADLEQFGADADQVVVEVRERHLADADRRHSVAALGAAGVEVLVENAGQGGVSLAELAALKVGGLKLGPSLLTPLREDDPLGVEVVRSLVLLAHGLGWRSLAVGVERDHQRSVLFGFGVDAVQGLAISPPLPLPALVDWLATAPRPGSR